MDSPDLAEQLAAARAEIERQHGLLRQIHDLCHEGILRKQDMDSIARALLRARVTELEMRLANKNALLRKAQGRAETMAIYTAQAEPEAQARALRELAQWCFDEVEADKKPVVPITGSNPPLMLAEAALQDLLRETDGMTMAELIEALLPSPQFTEAEIRAAVWTLAASGVTEIDGPRIRLLPTEADPLAALVSTTSA